MVGCIHLYVYSPLRFLECDFNCLSEQTSHMYGFSPLCYLECTFRVFSSVNVPGQVSHGFDCIGEHGLIARIGD